MKKVTRNVLLGIAAIGALFFFFRKPKQIENKGDLSEREIQALAKMLYAETSFFHDELESSAVVNVALNRAAHPGVSVETVVSPPGRPLLWNGSPIYAERYNKAPRTPNWERGLKTVKKIVSGEIANPIGQNRRNFVHPAGMPRCENGSCEHKGPRYVCVDGRCLPVWIVARRDGGQARNEPLNIGSVVVA